MAQPDDDEGDCEDDGWRCHVIKRWQRESVATYDSAPIATPSQRHIIAETLLPSDVGRVNQAMKPTNITQTSRPIAALSHAAKAATAEAITVQRMNLTCGLPCCVLNRPGFPGGNLA